MRVCIPAVTILLSLLLLWLGACDGPAPAVAKLPKSYKYEIYLSQMGRSYHLRSEDRRYDTFRHRPVPAGSVMFAYWVHRSDGSGTGFFNPPTTAAIDTVEVALQPAQADSLFTLTHAFFQSFELTNVDTVRRTQEVTDDVGGRLQIHWQGQTLVGDIIALHSSRVAQPSKAFYRVDACFDRLFADARRPKSPK